MASQEILTGVTSASPLIPALPTISNLILWDYFGTDVTHSPNAGTAGNITVGVGTPTFQSNYVSCFGLNGSLAMPSIVQQTNQTWMGVARYTGGGTGGAGGGLLTGGSTAGPVVTITATTISLSASGITAPLQSLSLASNGGNVFKFYAYTSQPNGPHTLYNLTDNTNAVVTATGTLTVATGVYGIGGVPTTTGANDRGSDIAWMAWAMTTLTKQQIDTIYAHVKAILALRGLTV